MEKQKETIIELAELYPELYDKEKPTYKDMQTLGVKILQIKLYNFKLKIKKFLRLDK